MKFQPKTKDEFNAERLLAKGTYDGLIIKAEEKKSAKGNDMIALTVQVYSGSQSVLVNDWLLAGSQKLLDFCETTGLADAYMRGEVDADMVTQRNVSVKVGVEEAKGEFPAKNKISAYVMKQKPQVQPAARQESAKGMGVSETQRRNAVANAKPDDDVPF
jgi:hypothetical protein